MTERGGGQGVEVSGGIGRGGWRTLSVEASGGMTERGERSVEGLAERGGGQWRE
ncbi:unnamed protein product [Staurois parvus]|uniref:AraC family transcriptional regulator n=1 Tax=Staurois parvus TaxID=386267 RepID=A0ABN9AST7_9NEOB|nr:unnamed protein product [Staurois parvus]